MIAGIVAAKLTGTLAFGSKQRHFDSNQSRRESGAQRLGLRFSRASNLLEGIARMRIPVGRDSN
ncbi:MAG: hypothetical protein WBV46_11705 [Terriglobales bacterium]|jgi:hypothetical protein